MDDDFAEIERIEKLSRNAGYWRGRADGGPLDGSEVSIEAVPFLPMRGMHLNVSVGEDVATAEWHSYVFGQQWDAERGAVGFFKHLGTIDGDPKTPHPAEDA